MNKTALALAVGMLALQGGVHAQQLIEEKMNGAKSTFRWVPLTGACLTAAPYGQVPGTNTGTIPACAGLPYYLDKGSTLVGGALGRLGSSNTALPLTSTVPDPVGSGALRLTNGDFQAGGNGDNQTGAVLSSFDMASNDGLEVTFKTATYGGDNLNGHGADGITFFLTDGAVSPVDADGTPNVGAEGGSLGYSCSNVNAKYDGVVGAYLGVGMDEYGNFSNPGDNSSNGPGFQPSRITIRGAGNTAWRWLNATYPLYYPGILDAAQRADAVRRTCRTGRLWNHGLDPNNGIDTGIALPYNYNYIYHRDLADNELINQQAIDLPLRSDAKKVTYRLKITKDGLLSLKYQITDPATGTTTSPSTVISNHPITASNGPLPARLRFGFSSGTGGGSNVHEIMCFKAKPAEQSSSSAGTNVQQSARVEGGEQIYLAFYEPSAGTGDLLAKSLVLTNGVLSIASAANWSADCNLTGSGSCSAVAGAPAVTAQNWDTGRTVLGYDGTGGVALRYAGLSGATQAALDSGDAAGNPLGSDRVNYLRGNRALEITSAAPANPFRRRDSLLGGIINSSPTWVGPPSRSYPVTWTDALYGAAALPENSGETYAAFKTNKATRQNMVYVGANDGLLHGFRAGMYNSSNQFVANNAANPNDGREILAYMPRQVANVIHNGGNPLLDFPNAQYDQNLYVDATPASGDVFYGGSWKTWLVGGHGYGGRAGGPPTGATAVAPATTPAIYTTTVEGTLYALNITDPGSFSETAADASAVVRGEWTPANLSCPGYASCATYFGAQTGTPVLRRLHNGQWAILFGNGMNSAAGGAGLYIGLIGSTGAVSFKFMHAGTDPAAGSYKNGIAYVTPADLDGDNIVDYVYGGDALGNVWRFDLTDSDAANWSVGASPVFSTGGLPITSRLAVASVPAGGQTRVMVAFGTGREMPATTSAGIVHATGQQSLFGVWDWNLNGWNTRAGQTTRYAALTGAAAPASTIGPSDLTAQQMADVTSGTRQLRTVTSNTVCWKGATTCATNDKYGWRLPLTGTNAGFTEQAIFNPAIVQGMFIINTVIPASDNDNLSCDNVTASGYTMAITMGNGGAPTESVFADAHGQYVPAEGGGIVVGVGLSATGTPSIVTAGQKRWFVGQNRSGTGFTEPPNLPAGTVGSRLNWLQLR
ncbi:MAG: PilC/PilY family type IV pilus protein [Burkholderiaceae bacterium]